MKKLFIFVLLFSCFSNNLFAGNIWGEDSMDEIELLQNDKIVQSSKGLKRSMELLVKGNDYGLSPEDYITGKQQAKIFLDRIIVANDSDYKEETNRAKIIKKLALKREQRLQKLKK